MTAALVIVSVIAALALSHSIRMQVRLTRVERGEVAREWSLPATEVLRPRPGDLVAFRHPGRLSDAAMRNIAESLRAIVPEGTRVVVLPEGARIELLHFGAMSASEGSWTGEIRP